MAEVPVLTFPIVAMLGLLGLTVFLFASEVVRVDVAALVIMLVLGLTGLAPAERLFDGFSSNAVISIIAVMILGAGLDRSGLMSRLAGWILKVGGNTERRVLAVLTATVGSVSGFVQNVGAAALFLPVASRISTRTQVPLSRLLMPMGFCALLGGTTTLIGSSPLILLNDLIAASSTTRPAGEPAMRSFGLFAVTPIGIVLLLAGIAYFQLLGRWVLPALKSGEGTPTPGASSEYLRRAYNIDGDIFEAYVPPGSVLDNLTVMEAEALQDAPSVVAIHADGSLRFAPPGYSPIPGGSTIGLLGSEHSVRAFAEAQGLRLRTRLGVLLESLSPVRSGICEMVLPPTSKLLGKSILDLEFRETYGATVLAILRHDGLITRDLRHEPFHAGDTLLVHGTWERIRRIATDRDFILVTDIPRGDDFRQDKAWSALAFFVIAIALVLFTDIRLSIALLVGAIGMVVSGVISIDEAYRSVSWQSVFLLASLLPLGAAVELTGTAAWIAHHFLVLFDNGAVWVVQAALAVLATLFTLLISNVGATVLLVPFAVNIALGVGADPAVFALTVALASSNSFMLPTHQVNALIMGPAGYRVKDFICAGAGLSVVFLVVLLLMLNLLF